MKKYILIILLSILACNSQQQNKYESLILKFIEGLKEEHTTELLLKEHFYFRSIVNNEDLLDTVIPIYDEVINKFKKILKSNSGNKPIKVVKYNKGEPQFIKFRDTENTALIYYVLLGDDLWFPVLFSEDKIISILIYKKNEASEFGSFVKF